MIRVLGGIALHESLNGRQHFLLMADPEMAAPVEAEELCTRDINRSSSDERSANDQDRKETHHRYAPRYLLHASMLARGIGRTSGYAVGEGSDALHGTIGRCVWKANG